MVPASLSGQTQGLQGYSSSSKCRRQKVEAPAARREAVLHPAACSSSRSQASTRKGTHLAAAAAQPAVTQAGQGLRQALRPRVPQGPRMRPAGPRRAT